MNQLTDIRSDLDKVFNTENILIIDSTNRDKTSFPNPNSFQMRLNQSLVAVKEIVLTHFIVNGGNVPGAYIYIIIDEFNTTFCYTPNCPMSLINFLVPGGINAYISQEAANDKVVMPKFGSINLSSITVKIIDNNGGLVPINDYVMKFYIRSNC